MRLEQRELVSFERGGVADFVQNAGQANERDVFVSERGGVESARAKFLGDRFGQAAVAQHAGARLDIVGRFSKLGQGADRGGQAVADVVIGVLIVKSNGDSIAKLDEQVALLLGKRPWRSDHDGKLVALFGVHEKNIDKVVELAFVFADRALDQRSPRVVAGEFGKGAQMRAIAGRGDDLGCKGSGGGVFTEHAKDAVGADVEDGADLVEDP